ncbi:uncharacterized protein LOC117224607 [Megalopta genalis]|uniref:uncharacterized protein LOC117224607 n=1 Tax=Megalopta genalis TaxID=115081 RepID=UPI003FD42881
MLVDRVFACMFLAVVGRIEAVPARMQRMTVAKMRAEDLESSASGYVYNQQQGLPVYYLHYTDHGSGSYYRTPDAVARYVGTPVAQTPILQPYAALDKGARQEIVTYANHRLPNHVPLPVESMPRAPYYLGKILERTENEDDKMHQREEEHDEDGHEDELNDHRDEDGDSDEDVQEDFDHSSEESDIGGDSGEGRGEFYGSHSDESGGSHSPRDGGSVSEDESGEQYAADEYSKHGEDGDKAYKRHRAFGKGERGAHDREHREGHYSENVEREKGHVDEGEAYGSNEEAVKGGEGSNYGHSSYHKKGDKTKGFHNVYHKDEYKKETDFYDEDHKKGYFDKFEKFDKDSKVAEHGFQKGGHRSSGHEQEDSGKEGYYDKGHDRRQDQGHRTEEGEKSYHRNHQDYVVEEGSKSAKEDKYHKGSY